MILESRPFTIINLQWNEWLCDPEVWPNDRKIKRKHLFNCFNYYMESEDFETYQIPLYWTANDINWAPKLTTDGMSNIFPYWSFSHNFLDAKVVINTKTCYNSRGQWTVYDYAVYLKFKTNLAVICLNFSHF